MSSLIISRPRLLQITSVAARGHGSIQPYSSQVDRKDYRSSVLPTDPGVKPFSAIPGPPSLPIVGNIPWYALGKYALDQPFEMYSGFFKKYGPLVKENLYYGSSLVHVFNPKDLMEIYKSEKSGFPYRASHKALQKHREARKELYAHIGVAPSNGDEWYSYRKLMGKYPDDYKNHINNEAFEMIADELVEYLKSNLDHNNEIPLLPALYYFTLECMGVVALGIRMGCFDRNRRSDVTRFIQAVHETHYSIHQTELKPYIFARKAYKTLDISQEYIANFVLKHMNLIKERMELASIKNIDPFDEKMMDDDIDLEEDKSDPLKTSMCLVYDKLKKGMSDRMMLPMASDFFQGGIHSTAHSLTFALYHLALNPEEQEILRERIDEDKDFYLKLVIKEVLRLNPPAIGTGRILRMDMVLNGYHVPKGTKVILHQEIAAKNEENFPEPLRFMPERMKKLKEYEQTYSYQPFIDHSSRMCLGASIANAELIIALKKIVKAFKISYHHERIGVRNYLLNEPDRPIKMKLEAIPASPPKQNRKTGNEISKESIKPTLPKEGSDNK